MPLLYKRRWQLKEKHTDSITALSFNKNGRYLASASMDSRLCVWTPSQGTKFTIQGAAGFISLAWVDENILLSGTEDGRLIAVEFSDVLLRVTGFEAHTAPLECLDVRGNRLATGAHSHVSIWDLVPGHDNYEACTHLHTLKAPPTSGPTQNDAVIVLSVAWAPSLAPEALVVSYMDHGVVIWDTTSGSVIRSLQMRASSVFSSLSPDGRWLAVSNFTTGFDVYDTTLMAPTHTIVHDDLPIGSPHPPRISFPLTFVHDGGALAGVTPSGLTGLWDWKMERFLHGLPHEGDPIISSLAAYCNQNQDEYVIATGTALVELGKGTVIQIWQTQHTGEPPSQTSSTPNLSARIHPSGPSFTLCHVSMLAVALVVGGFIHHTIQSIPNQYLH